MNDQTDAAAIPAEESLAIDPAVVERVLMDLRSQQNLFLGFVGGLGASLVGAALWMIVTVMTGYQIGWMAIGVGFLVGIAVRYAGKGIDMKFAVMGAGLALFGCLLGNLLAICQLIANDQQIPFMAIMQGLTPVVAAEILIATFTPIDLLFYGFALYQGYQFSTRQITAADLQAAMEAEPSVQPSI